MHACVRSTAESPRTRKRNIPVKYMGRNLYISARNSNDLPLLASRKKICQKQGGFPLREVRVLPIEARQVPFGSGNPRTSLLRGREDRREPNGGWNGAWRAGAPFAEEGGTREGREGPNVPHRHRKRMEDKGSFPGTLGIERGARHQLIFGVAPSPQERKQLPKPQKI